MSSTKKLSNDENIKNLKIRKNLRILMIIFASLTIVLVILNLFYNVNLVYCDKKDSARIIHDILYYHAREYLKTVE